MRILLVDDDECTAKTLEKVLGDQRYVVDIAADGQVGWQLVQTFTYDLILLDVILPKLDGIKLCQKLRSHAYQMPVLLLTARNSSTDKVIGLDAGADDYVVKPFELSELLARIRVLLRRRNSPILLVLEWENLLLDPGTCEVTYSGRVLHLTPKEYRLLELFLRNRHLVFSRSAILEHLWAVEESPSEDTVTAHVKGLRQKLKQAGAPTDFIETVYGLGYRLKPPTSSTHLIPSPTKESLLQQQTKTALAEVWKRLKVQSSDRLAVLEQATTALQAGNLGNELQQQALFTAHKLSGSLGIFGFAEGSRLAREIEQMLQSRVPLDQSQVFHLSKLVLALKRELQEASSGQRILPMASHAYPLLLVVDNDAELTEGITRLAVASGIRIKLAPNLSTVRDMFVPAPIDVVLLNLSLANTAEDSLLAELANQTPSIPVLICTAHDNLTARVRVSRLVAHAFLPKPLLSDQSLTAVLRLLKQVRTHTAKVMVVDDDPQVLAVMRALLEPWGLKLTVLDEPLQFWNVLEEFSPDLLVLDVEMPHFNGIELCQVVRNDPRWSGLPVLFCTVHNDERTVHQALTAGANDCFSKSIIGPELVTRVIERLERVRLLQSMTALVNNELR